MNRSEVKRYRRKLVDLYVVTHACRFQADDLERDAFEVIRLVRSIKNTFAPVNRLPLDVLSLIPDYYSEDDVDRALIALTHVCHGWRDLFISRPSLWTRLDFKNTHKTRAYIRRSRPSPLNLHLKSGKINDGAFSLVVPLTRRFESLTIDRLTLQIGFNIGSDLRSSSFPGSPINTVFFNRDLSSLRELHLCGVIAYLPWRNLTNLRVVKLRLGRGCGKNQILNFLESAPLLHTVHLAELMSEPFSTSANRTVHLPNLKDLTIDAAPRHSMLLHHLHIPTGASVTISQSRIYGEEYPLLDYLPERSPAINNISHITAINLLLNSTRKCVQLSGPSGSLRLLVKSEGWRGFNSYVMDHQIFSSLTRLVIPEVRTLVVSDYWCPSRPEVEASSIFQMLSYVNNLRTIVLVSCKNASLISALDPRGNSSNLVLCSNLERIIVYFSSWSTAYVKSLLATAKNRASTGAKLSSIAFIDLRGLEARKEDEISTFKDHATRVEYGVLCAAPAWDEVPDESVDERGNLGG